MKWNKLFVLAVLMCVVLSASGQKEKKDKLLNVSGTVVNQDKRPIVGAPIFVDNIKTSFFTKEDGSYKIKVSSSATTLGIHSSQYGNCDTPIEGHTIIDFMLTGEDNKVVFAGNNDKDRPEVNDNNTGKGKNRKMNTYNDIYQMIRSEVSGVTVSGRSVQIQQGHSFIGSGAPLFVINGVVVNTIDEVNPLEVKSIKVLKGSEAAIYGVRGSNGVISITLKNGTEKEQ